MPDTDLVIDGGTSTPIDYTVITVSLEQDDKDYLVNTTVTNTINSLNPTLDLILGMTQNNFRLNQQIYDASGNLIAAQINLYYNASDCTNQVNSFATYNMLAVYNVQNQLIDYKVIAA
jgi:hypothetical protein